MQAKYMYIITVIQRIVGLGHIKVKTNAQTLLYHYIAYFARGSFWVHVYVIYMCICIYMYMYMHSTFIDTTMYHLCRDTV